MSKNKTIEQQVSDWNGEFEANEFHRGHLELALQERERIAREEVYTQILNELEGMKLYDKAKKFNGISDDEQDAYNAAIGGAKERIKALTQKNND